MTEDIFDDKNFGADTEMSINTVDWGKPGDYIMGTFIKARHHIETQFGENSIYEILANKGQFYQLIGSGKNAKPADKPITINKNEIWSIWGRNEIFNGQMNNLKPGQVVKIEFFEETEKSGAKIIKIYAPKNNEGKLIMNEEWLNEQSLVGGDM